MPTQTVTDPIILDSTGQDIVEVLNDLKNAVQPTNVCVDISTSLPANGWSQSSPYVQIWTNNKVTDECAVKVEFPAEATNTGITYLEYEKVAGGVKFTAPSLPSTAIPVIVHIINAEAESITSISADMVSTSAVSGSSNVDEALGALNGKLTVETGKSVTLESGASETFAWNQDDAFCFAVIRSASNTTTATFASSDTNNRLCRIYNTFGSQQTVYFSLVHIK